MRRLLVTIALLFALGGCLREWSLPPLPGGSTGNCQVDEDCNPGVCIDRYCDYTKCNDDSDCQYGICMPDNKCDATRCKDKSDCMYGLCVDERCDVLQCEDQSDCSYGLCIDGQCDTEACIDDGDCTTGLCVDGKCDIYGCKTDTDCYYGLCIDNRCDYTKCNVNNDCSMGLCLDGTCDLTACRSDSDCTNAICVEGTCDSMSCRVDSDCYVGSICAKLATEEFGGCVPTSMLGPPVQGDPHALRMDDNLESAFDFINSQAPGAELVLIQSTHVGADGTIDITQESAMWYYLFQIGDGSTEPAEQATLFYSNFGRGVYAMYSAPSDTSSPDPVIPEADWRAFKDATELVSAFLAEPGCVAHQGVSGDSIYYNYDEDESAPYFYLGNWKSQSYRGNPVTGEVEYLSCD